MTSARPLEPPAAHASLACRIALPESLEGMARYAIGELLRPLGLRPAWTSTGDERHGLWYGTGDGLSPGNWVRLEVRPDTLDFFAAPGALVADRIPSFEWQGTRVPVLFKGSLGGRVDPVATAFYWLSGMHERRTAERDRHGRFPGDRSLQAALGIEHEAPVDDLRAMLAEALSEKGVSLYRRSWDGRAWCFCPTHDVDYVRKWRPGIIWREIVQYGLLNRRGVPGRDRLDRLGRSLRDMVRPGDPFLATLNRIPVEHERAGAAATWFFKAGEHGPNDVGYRLESRAVRHVLAGLARRKHEIGLHPGYHAHAHEAYVRAERDRLTGVVGTAPASARTHYLRWAPHATPRILQSLGFSIDSSLGFADRAGFRHGTTVPFRIWDHDAGRPVDLWEFPLGVMESALFNRCGLDLDAALDRTERLMDTCERHGGVLVGLWHTTLWDEEDFPGWGEHFTTTLARARERGAAMLTLRSALTSWRPEAHPSDGDVPD